MTKTALLASDETLKGGLNQLLNGGNEISLTVLSRERNEYASSRAPSEIVSCRLSDDRVVTLFCKYENPSCGLADLIYEAKIYQEVVAPSGLPAPKYYGSFFDRETNQTCVVLQYLDDAMLLSELRESDAMGQAAEWLGRFHALQAKQVSDPNLQFLRVAKGEYYFERMRRAVDDVPAGNEEFGWLSSLSERFERFAAPLMAQRPVVTHGDFYLHNLLYKNGAVYPIDWELAAIDAGEIDLACLIDGWNGDTATECISRYQAARWPNGAPDDFAETVDAARACLCFYNLGTRAGWTTDPQGQWYCRQLRRITDRLGLN